MCRRRGVLRYPNPQVSPCSASGSRAWAPGAGGSAIRNAPSSRNEQGRSDAALALYANAAVVGLRRLYTGKGYAARPTLPSRQKGTEPVGDSNPCSSIGNLNDPVVLVAVSLVLFVVTMMSAAIPANRAASIQPVDALRTD